jgi:hypothetical protein
MNEHESHEQDQHESALLRAQEHKGFGDDEGEREESLESEPDDEEEAPG